MLKKKGSFKMGVGISSLLLIFVVLCLTTFAVLSYLTANADHKLTDKTGDTVSAYYTAAATAQGRLSGIDAALKARGEAALKIVQNNSADGVDASLLSGREQAIAEILSGNGASKEKAVYQQLIAGWAAAEGGETFSFSEEEMTISFTVEEPASSEPGDKGRAIAVSLLVNADPAASSRYEIIRHTVEQPGEGSEDEPLNLWPGN